MLPEGRKISGKENLIPSFLADQPGEAANGVAREPEEGGSAAKPLI
jgi:hypothetical protein